MSSVGQLTLSSNVNMMFPGTLSNDVLFYHTNPANQIVMGIQGSSNAMYINQSNVTITNLIVSSNIKVNSITSTMFALNTGGQTSLITTSPTAPSVLQLNTPTQQTIPPIPLTSYATSNYIASASTESGTVQSFPSAAMTSTAGVTIAGQGQYIASSSTNNGAGTEAYRAFDLTSGTNPWLCTNNLYSSTGVYQGTTVTSDIQGKSYSGEWLQIQMPQAVAMTGYNIQCQTNASSVFPSSFIVLGSINGTQWFTLNKQTIGLITTGATTPTYQIQSCAYFTYYRIVIGATNSGGTYAAIDQWNIYGILTATNPAYLAFDQSPSTYWQAGSGSNLYSSTGTYTASNSTVTTTTTGTNTSVAGEWVQIQLPQAIVPSSAQITSLAGPTLVPAATSLLASKDGNTWNLVASNSSNTLNTFTLTPTSSANAASYFRLVTSSNASSNSPAITSFNLIGTPQPITTTTTGQVGIGITNPTQQLEVAGNAIFNGAISATNMGLFRNRIINGSMQINQRAATTYVSASGNNYYYNADRFYWLNNSSTAGTITATPTPLSPLDAPYKQGITTALTITANSAVTATSGILGLVQAVEAYNMQDFGWTAGNTGSPVTLSFWLKTNITSTTIPIAINNYIAGQGTYTTSVLAAASNSWQYVQVTIPPPPSTYTWNTGSAGGLTVSLGGYTGSSTASNNAWSAPANIATSSTGSTNIWSTTNNYVQVTGLQLEKGTLATPFEFRPYQVELQLCQRYYNKTYEMNIAPGGSGTNQNINGAYMVLSTAYLVSFTYIFPQRMRSVPTVTTYSHLNGTAGYISSSGAEFASSQQGASVQSAMVFANTANAGSSYMYAHFVAVAEL